MKKTTNNGKSPTSPENQHNCKKKRGQERIPDRALILVNQCCQAVGRLSNHPRAQGQLVHGKYPPEKI
jgi:hypothetical protein